MWPGWLFAEFRGGVHVRIMPEDWTRELTVPVDAPVFLVQVWTCDFTWSPTNGVWSCEETGLAECDVHEAIVFARNRTPEGGQYTLHACYFDERGNGVMVLLAGQEPIYDPDEEGLRFTWY